MTVKGTGMGYRNILWPKSASGSRRNRQTHTLAGNVANMSRHVSTA